MHYAESETFATLKKRQLWNFFSALVSHGLRAVCNALWHNYNDTRTLLFYQEIFDLNRIQLTPKSNEHDLQTASRGGAICAVI